MVEKAPIKLATDLLSCISELNCTEFYEIVGTTEGLVVNTGCSVREVLILAIELIQAKQKLKYNSDNELMLNLLAESKKSLEPDLFEMLNQDFVSIMITQNESGLYLEKNFSKNGAVVQEMIKAVRALIEIFKNKRLETTLIVINISDIGVRSLSSTPGLRNAIVALRAHVGSSNVKVLQ